MPVLGYAAAAAVALLGVFVVRRLIRSWRDADGGDDAGHGEGSAA